MAGLRFLSRRRGYMLAGTLTVIAILATVQGFRTEAARDWVVLGAVVAMLVLTAWMLARTDGSN